MFATEVAPGHLFLTSCGLVKMIFLHRLWNPIRSRAAIPPPRLHLRCLSLQNVEIWSIRVWHNMAKNVNPKFDLRCFQKPSKIFEKWSNIVAKMVQNRRLEEAWAALGAYRAVLDVSWGFLGASWGVLGTSWGVLGSSWEASWARLEASWGLSWGWVTHLLGSPRASWDVLGASWAWLWYQKAPKWGIPSWITFFNRFLSDLPSENRSPNLEKSLNSSGKPIFFGFQAIST